MTSFTMPASAPSSSSSASNSSRCLSGETANLAIPDGSQVVFVSQVETPQHIRAYFRAGTRSAIHASGIGKAVMAYWSREQVTEIVRDTSLPAFTPQTVTDPAALAVELKAIRERGWAVDDGEHTAGMRCIGAAVFNEHGEPIGGLSISGPAARIVEDRDAEFGAAVLMAGTRLTDAIGGRAPPR